MKIELDGHGYPLSESLQALRLATPGDGDVTEFVREVLDAVGEAFEASGTGCCLKYSVGVEDWAEDLSVTYYDRYEFVTGGWSGNEEIIDAIPSLVRGIAWESSHRGGLHDYRVESRAVERTCGYCKQTYLHHPEDIHKCVDGGRGMRAAFSALEKKE